MTATTGEPGGPERTVEFDPNQKRAPKGNGLLSGRWVDTPRSALEKVAPSLVDAPPQVRSTMRDVQRKLRSTDPNLLDTDYANIQAALKVLDYAAVKVEDAEHLVKIEKAIKALEQYSNINWMFGEQDNGEDDWLPTTDSLGWNTFEPDPKKKPDKAAAGLA